MKMKIVSDAFVMITTLPNILKTGKYYYYFTDFTARVFPHGRLFKEFMAGNKLNLENSTISEVNKAVYLYVLATQNAKYFKTYENPREEIFNIACNDLIINPLPVHEQYAGLTETKSKFDLWKQSILIEVPKIIHR